MSRLLRNLHSARCRRLCCRRCACSVVGATRLWWNGPMRSVDDDYRDIQLLSTKNLTEWIERHFPEGAPISWWVAIFEMFESSLSPTRTPAMPERKKYFESSLRFIMLSADRNDLSPELTSYWLLRLTALGLREPTVAALPTLLTPDGAAKWTLAKMSISREIATQYAVRRDAMLDNKKTRRLDPQIRFQLSRIVATRNLHTAGYRTGGVGASVGSRCSTRP
jgi:hypothetical protein